jgi:hypothetical protein
MDKLNFAEAVNEAAKVSPADLLASDSQTENEEITQEETQEEEMEQPLSQEEETKEPEPSEEPSASTKDVPFHHHPRFKRLTEENKELKEQLDQIKSWKEQVESAKRNDPQAEVNKTVPDELRGVFGDDYAAYQAMENHLSKTAQTLAERIYQEKIQEQERQKQEEEQQTSKILQLYEEQLAELGEEIGEPLYDPKNSARNEILKICEEKKIFTEDGYPNFRLANELRLLNTKKADNTERKKVAANAGAASLGEGTPVTDDTVYSPSRLRKTSLAQILKNK